METPSVTDKIRHAANRWGVRIGTPIAVVLVVLAQIHPIEGAYLLIPLSVLILVLSEQLNELMDKSKKSTDEFGKQIGAIKSEVSDQSAAIRTLTEILSPNLLGLPECVIDLSEALKLIPNGAPVLIEHFALDMTQAWLYCEAMLRTHPNLSNVEYRLLMLTDDISKLTNADEEVLNWARNVPQSLDTIRRDITAIFKKPEYQHRTINFEIRQYASIPIIHGFRIVRPDLRCYIAICRWGGLDYQKYEWGEPRYQRLMGEASSPAVQDMLKIFDGYFNHHWQIGDRIFRYKYPPDSVQ